MIDYALERVNQLTIVVCHTTKCTIPVELRREWIQDTYPQAEVKALVHDPALDSDSPTISNQWAKLTIDFLGFAPEAVFSSEDYGPPYATHMGSKHFMVDHARQHVDISATRIRSDPYRYWDYIDSQVKAHYAKRIVVLGAESTGTTTLAKRLAKHYQTTWVPEYGRSYYEGKMHSLNANVWNTDEFVHIAKTQNSMEEALAGQCNKILICDTDSLATCVWHQRFLGSKSNRLEPYVQAEKHSLYIITDTDIPFVQDGTRNGEHLREWLHKRFVDELSDRKVPFVIVKGTVRQRHAQAIGKIHEVIGDIPV